MRQSSSAAQLCSANVQNVPVGCKMSHGIVEIFGVLEWAADMFRPIPIRHKFAAKSKKDDVRVFFFFYHPLCAEVNLPLGFGPLTCALILVDERDRISGTRCCIVCIKLRIHSSTLMLKRHAIHASMSARFIKDRYTTI